MALTGLGAELLDRRMDNFPEHLKPRFEPGGAVEEPFEEWWPKVREHFPNVPEDAARYWLHEHWNRSPYRYLISKAYEFTRAEWPAERLFEVRSTWDDYSEGSAGCVAKGKELCTQKTFGYIYETAAFVLEHGRVPAPIIVLDNRDGHHAADYPNEWPLPLTYVLIEGHSRFNICIYLHTKGRVKNIDLWLMTKISA
jgi:hypothetical protein